MEGVSGIYRLILGTFPIVDPARKRDGRSGIDGSQALLGALRRAGPERDIIDAASEPDRSLRNHHCAPRRINGRPLMLGHDGHPAGLSNGKRPELPAPDDHAGPA